MRTVGYAVSRYSFGEALRANSFGQQQAQGGGQGGGAAMPSGGGMGMGASISVDPAAIITAVTGTVAEAKAMENNPAVFFREMTEKFASHVAKVNKLNKKLRDYERELKEIRGREAQYVANARARQKVLKRWLENPRRKFQSGPWKGKWKDPIGVQIRKDEQKFISKHGATRGDLPKKNHWKLRKKHLRDWAAKNWTHKNRTDLRSFWQRAMNIESLRPLLGGTPEGMALMIHANTEFALDRNNLRLIFPDRNEYPYLKSRLKPAITGARDAKKGFIPRNYVASKQQDIIGLFSKGWLSGTIGVPNWLLNKKPTNNPLDLTPMSDVFALMYKGKPEQLKQALRDRAAILERAGVIEGQKAIEKIEAPQTSAVKMEQAHAKAMAAQAAMAPPPMEPEVPAYDPYAYDPYSQDPYSQDPYAQQPSGYPQYPQDPYAQYPGYQQGYGYPQQQQPSYYPPQQYPQGGYPQYPQYPGYPQY